MCLIKCKMHIDKTLSLLSREVNTMQVVGFVGSPRKGGNTQLLVERVLSGASSKGAQTSIYFLNELNIRGCQACNYCKEHGECRQQDDMVQLYKAIKEAKGLVIGSPIYMDYLSAQTKLFLDRLFAFLGPDLRPTLPPGKRAVLVYSQGGGNNPEVMDSLAKFLRGALGIEVRGVVGGNGFNELGAVKNRDDLLDKAFSLGQELASE